MRPRVRTRRGACVPARAAAAVAAVGVAVLALTDAGCHGAPSHAVEKHDGADAGTPEVDVSPELRALLEADGEDGAPVVSADDAAYLLAELPAHARALVEAAVADEWITSAVHLRALLALRLSAAKIEVALEDNCLLCHTDPESQGENTLLTWSENGEADPGHMHLELFASDVHFRRGLSCAGCHGGDPEDDFGHEFVDEWPENMRARRQDRSWVPGFCGRCHADTAFMRGFNPGLPTDQLAKYRGSRHGILLLEGKDSRAAECTSCHGLHGIQGPSSPRSHVYPTRVPETCAACHSDAAMMAGLTRADGSPLPTDQFEAYRTSVHGRALLERGDLGAPACNDCHGNHAAMPPQIASVSQVCRNCHANNGTLFDGSRHKDAFEQHGWPECGSCHGKHAIAEPTDAQLAPEPGSMCASCHEEHARDNPNCSATASFFHDQITALVASHDWLESQSERLVHLGVDAQPILDELDVLADSLRTARTSVHAFERSEFEKAAAPGHEASARGKELLREARSELAHRALGLLIAGVFIAATMLALWLKLRALESGR